MTAVGKMIRITDLRNPMLTDAAREALKHAEHYPVELSEDAVLAAARHTTGLDDFGPDDFRERMGRWLHYAAADSNRTALGRSRIFDTCVRFTSARLRLQDLLHRHPEIHDLEIRQPIIIVGPPRSAGTHLHNLLAADSRLRSVPEWEKLEPIPAPADNATSNGVNPRYARSVEYWQHTRALLPNLAAMHPLGPDIRADDVKLSGPDFPSAMWKWEGRLRPWRHLDFGHDQAPRYEYLKTTLKALQWQRGPERWVIKSCSYAEHLGPLLATFPDAVIVMTHRDPISVVQSYATMMAYVDRLDYHEVDVDSLIADWAECIETLLQASIRDRHLVPESQLVDVHFHEFMADEIGTAERIYAAAGLELSDRQRKLMVAYLAEHPRGKSGRVMYDIRNDFGVNPAELRTQFAFYYRRFAVAAEVQ